MIKYKQKKNCILILSGFLLLLSSCSTRHRNALFTSKSDLVTDTIKTVYVVNSNEEKVEQYHIKPNDVLAIRNLQDISLITVSESKQAASQATTFRVEEDGGVALPVIGKVAVLGLSRKDAADKIQALYKQSLLKDPIIEVTVVNLKVTLLGEFTKQGNFLLDKENTSLIDIIGEAGGLTPRANPKTLKIIRGDRSNPELIYVNLKDINSLASQKLILKNNDIIYIEAQGIYNTSDRLQSVSSIFQPILIILNTALIIYSFTR